MASRQLSRRSFIILIGVVIVTGWSQGLLLPLLSVLLEQAGVTSTMNGLNAAAMYVGTFATMFVIERPVRRYGYKAVIGFGMTVVTIATLLFPTTDNLWVWFALRLAIGVGDSALHYSTQLWITASSPAERRGRNISLYGMSYAIGFSIGPLGINLLPFGTWAPFGLSALIFGCVLALFLTVPGDAPEPFERGQQERQGRYARVYRLAWFALIPSLLYGYMEASTNGNFPVYGLRMDWPEAWISLLLPLIGIGSLILQLPLGIWSDRIGRKPVLVGAGLAGALAFIAVPWAGDNAWLVALLFLLAGGFIGSFFSLGLAYAADLLPRGLLPTASALASIQFSLASIIGPNAGGLAIEYWHPGGMFWLLGGSFLLFAAAGMFFKPANFEYNK